MSQVTPSKIGLALGDALSRSASVQRLNIIGMKRINRYQSLQNFGFTKRQTNVLEPYTHGAPGGVLSLKAGDDTEWFAFSQSVLRSGGDFSKAWSDLSGQRDQVRGKISVLSALDNIHHGKLAPVSGHDNPHYFDNAGLVRSLAHLESAKNWPNLEETITSDVTHTNSLDGLWCSLALVKTLWEIKSGSDCRSAINLGLDMLPRDSLSFRIVSEYLRVSIESSSVFELAIAIEFQLMDRIYSYPYGAAETLGLTYAYLAQSTAPDQTLAATFMHSRYNDSLPAVMGFCLAEIFGGDWLMSSYRLGTQPLDGFCIPWLKGTNLE